MNKKIKILTVIVTPNSHFGGAWNAAIELSRSLAKNKKIKVTIAAMANITAVTKDQKISVNKFKIRKPALIPAPYNTVLISPGKLVKEIRKDKYDIIHIHNTHPAIAVAQIAKRCIDQKIPYIISSHGIVEASKISETYKKNLLVKVFSKLLMDIPLTYALHNAQKIAALTKYEQPILKKYNVNARNIKIVYNGIDPEIYKNNKKSNYLQKFKLEKQEKIILFVGALKQNKGVDVLIKAAPYLKNCKIFIVGQPVNKKFEKYLSDLTKLLRVEDKIKFTGKVNKDVLSYFYHKCDVFVLPTLADTLPLCILDAMACKKPIVSTRVGGIPEEVDPSNGILVKPNDPVALAKAIQKILNNKALRIKMGASAYKKVQKKFTWEEVANSVVKIYEEISQTNKI